MRLLAVADEEDKGLWDYYSRDKLQGAELILALRGPGLPLPGISGHDGGGPGVLCTRQPRRML